MIEPIQLAAIVADGPQRSLQRIPVTRGVQSLITSQWNDQFEEFVKDADKIKFDPAYTPEVGELFEIDDLPIPDWLNKQTSEAAEKLPPLNHDDKSLQLIKGIVGFTKLGTKDIALFQNFSRSHILRPGRFLLLTDDVFSSVDTPGLSLSDKLAGVLYTSDAQLLFASFRAMNVILPLADFYREASETEIREVLANPMLAPENVDAIAVDASQWMQKRFALLADSDVLEKFTPKTIQTRGKKFNVTVQVKKGKIVFPADKGEAKRLLQFLNEEIFLGAITDRRFTTNSKKADE